MVKFENHCFHLLEYLQIKFYTIGSVRINAKFTRKSLNLGFGDGYFMSVPYYKVYRSASPDSLFSTVPKFWGEHCIGHDISCKHK